MKSICKNCRTKDDCSYLNRGMERDCIDVQTWEDGWDAAIDAAVDWLQHELYTDRSGADSRFPNDVRSMSYYTVQELIDDFKKELLDE